MLKPVDMKALRELLRMVPSSGGNPKAAPTTRSHTLDQFFRVEEGAGEAVLDGVRTPLRGGSAVVVPAGTNHNIINTGRFEHPVVLEQCRKTGAE